MKKVKSGELSVKSFSKGFTLIELLVVVAITGVMVVVGTNIFIDILRSATKAAIITQIRENGNNAIEAISRYVQNASAPVDIDAGACPKWIVLKNKITDASQPLYTRMAFVEFPPASTNNSYVAIDTGSDLTALESIPSPTSITNNSSASSAVDIATTPAACFTQETNGDVTVVIVKFALKQSRTAPQRQEFGSTIPFQTTFTTRIY